ncbi:MAG: c-type cytochrome [Thermoanaerobaculia bacterium]
MIRISTATLTASLLFAASSAWAAESTSPPKEPSPEVPAEKFYKNIQVFQGLPSTDLVPAMKFMADSLGVKCSFCHVTNDKGHWPMESDDKPAKGKAREMIRMMREIDRANFKGRLEVTCATCHHGSNDPASMPPLVSESLASHGRGSVPPDAPSVDSLLEKSVAAVGGKTAIEAVHSRRLQGTFTAADGEPHPIEVVQTEAGKYRSSVTVKDGSFTLVFDGKSGTSAGPSWKNPMMPDEIARIRSRARLFPAFGLKARFPALAVLGRESVGGREAWRVVGRNAEGERATFWFDAESGLLLRTLEREHTALGDIPEQADYSDYREVGAVRVPFVIRHEAPDRTDTITATEMKQNVDVDEKSFQLQN